MPQFDSEKAREAIRKRWNKKSKAKLQSIKNNLTAMASKARSEQAKNPSQSTNIFLFKLQKKSMLACN